MINLYVSIFTGFPRRPTSTHAPARELSGNRSAHESGDEATTSVSVEVRHKIGKLNAYIFFF